jgi:hypothetical protein
MSDMKYDALIADLRCQYARYRGSGTRMEQMLKDAGAALAKARLTDDEREAIAEAAGAYNDNDDDEECAKIAATLRNLLERTK